MCIRHLLACLMVLFLNFMPSLTFAEEAEVRHWSFSLVRAAQVRGGLKNTLTDHWPAYISFLRAAKEFAGSRDGLAWEVEGQLVKHLGLQHHWETNGLVVARWHPFPWDRYLDTSFAIGEGLSYATDVPEVELARGKDTARLLNYLLFELTFALPKYPNVQLVTLMHHRSGAYGLFSGVVGGSNFFGSGIKYMFM